MAALSTEARAESDGTFWGYNLGITYATTASYAELDYELGGGAIPNCQVVVQPSLNLCHDYQGFPA